MFSETIEADFKEDITIIEPEISTNKKLIENVELFVDDIILKNIIYKQAPKYRLFRKNIYYEKNHVITLMIYFQGCLDIEQSKIERRFIYDEDKIYFGNNILIDKDGNFINNYAYFINNNLKENTDENNNEYIFKLKSKNKTYNYNFATETLRETLINACNQYNENNDNMPILINNLVYTSFISLDNMSTIQKLDLYHYAIVEDEFLNNPSVDVIKGAITGIGKLFNNNKKETEIKGLTDLIITSLLEDIKYYIDIDYDEELTNIGNNTIKIIKNTKIFKEYEKRNK